MFFNKLRGKIAGSVLALGALGAAEQVGEHRGEKTAVIKQTEEKETERTSAVAEALLSKNSEEAKTRGQAELHKQFLDTQDNLVQTLEKTEIKNLSKDISEVLFAAEKERRIKILNEYKTWLLANNEEEMLKSRTILARLKRGSSNEDDSGVGLRGIQNKMMADDDFNHRIRYIFDEYKKYKDRTEKRLVEELKSGKITEETYKVEKEALNIRLENLAEYCISKDLLKSKDFITHQIAIIKHARELQVTPFEAERLQISPKALEILNSKAIDFAATKFKDYATWFSSKTFSEAWNSASILSELRFSGDRKQNNANISLVKEMVEVDPDFKRRMEDTLGVLVKTLDSLQKSNKNFLDVDEGRVYKEDIKLKISGLTLFF